MSRLDRNPHHSDFSGLNLPSRLRGLGNVVSSPAGSGVANFASFSQGLRLNHHQLGCRPSLSAPCLTLSYVRHSLTLKRYSRHFNFFVYTITEAKQWAGQSQRGKTSSQVISHPSPFYQNSPTPFPGRRLRPPPWKRSGKRPNLGLVCCVCVICIP